MREQADVLIVEDEAVVRGAARRILADEGLSVAQAETGPAALQALESLSCRLVLCDLMLPDVSGFELIPRLVERAPETPVVVITGYATVRNALEVFALGSFDFLPKPFDVPELVGVVRRGLRYRDRPASRRGAEVPPGAGRQGETSRYGIGRHAWASLDADGSATFGVAETFHHLVGDRESIDLPAVEDNLAQAKSFARMPAEGALYRVWAPLSGRVITLNPRIVQAPELLDEDPFGEGWLVRVIPANLDEELSALTRR